MKRSAYSTFAWFVLLLAGTLLNASSVQAQNTLLISKDANFSTSDREFSENDIIFMKVESSDVDFSSVRTSKYRLTSRAEDSEFTGEFENKFDGTFVAELPVAELDLVDYLWELEGFIEDAAGNKFETRLLLRIGDVQVFTGFEARAVVEEKGDGFFVLKGHRFHVDGETQFVVEPHFVDNPDDPGTFPHDQGPVPATFEDLQVQFGVRVKAERNDDGVLLARQVEIGGPVHVPGFVAISGRVESVDNNTRTLILRGRTVQILPETQVGNSQETVGSDEIPPWIVGRVLRIYGDFQDDGSIVAHYVELQEGMREELQVTGRVESVQNNIVFVQGFRFVITEQSSIEYDRDEPGDDAAGNDGSFADIDAGLIVRVHAIVGPQGNHIVERLEVESGVDNGVRLGGTIESISETGFGIRGWFVEISEHTGLFNENFEPLPVEELVEGQLVQLFGEFREGDLIEAHHIELRRASRDEFTLFGPVTEIGDGSFKVWDAQFTVTPNSRFEKSAGEVFGFEGLTIGQLVEATGIPDVAGQLNLDRAFIPDGHGDFVRLAGEALSVTPEGFQVLGLQVSTPPETFWRDQYFQPVEPGGVVDGTAIMVFGNFEGEGVVRAHEVVLSNSNREEIEMWGTIDEIAGDIVTVQGVPFTWTGNSQIHGDHVEDPQGGGLTPGDLAPGMQISIMGVVDDSGVAFIEWIFVPQQLGDQVRIAGEAADITQTGMSLWGQTVVFTETTQYLGADYQPVGPEAIINGLAVEVFGFYDNNGDIRADVVEIRQQSREELSLTGDVDSFDGFEVIVAGTPFRIASHTQVYVDGEDNAPGADPNSPGKYSGIRLNPDAPGKFSGRQGGLEDLQAGALVEVIGTLDETGGYTAVVIRIHNEQGSVRLSGTIESLDIESLVLQGRFVRVSLETLIQSDTFEPIPFDALVEGQGIEVSGQLLADGSMEAHYIEVRPDVPEQISLNGQIDSAQGDIVVVNGEAFLVTDFTFLNSEDGSTLTLADLLPGMRVEVQGERDEAGVQAATSIFVQGNYVWAWMGGLITAVDTGSLQMQGRTILVDENTFIFGTDFQQITLADVQAGQEAFVSGEILDTGELKAGNVELRPGTLSELEVWGPIASVNGDVLEIGNRVYVLTASTFIFGEDGLEMSPGELAAGQFVRLLGRSDGTGGMVVVKVHVESRHDNSNVRMSGAIQDLLTEGFTMQGRAVLINEETMIVGNDYEPIPLEALAIDQFVNVHGGMDASGNMLAYKVEMMSGQQSEVELRGVIESADGQTVVVKGLTFAIDSESVIDDGRGFPVDPAGLLPGMLVKVIGAADDAGGLRLRYLAVGATDDDRHVYLSAAITSIDHAGRALELMGRTVFVEEFADVVGANFEFIPFSDIPEGSSVRIFGRYEEGGVIVAHRVELRDGSDNEEIEFRGRIQTLNGELVVVRGMDFVITPNTYVSDEIGNPISPEQLVPGQVVGIAGTPLAGGQHQALRIHVSTGNEDRGMQVSGRIVEMAASEGTFWVRDHEIVLSDYTEIVGDQYEPIRFEALQQGYQVSVWGWMRDDGKLEAHRIELRIPEKQEFRIVGPLTAIDGSTLVVRSIPFATTDQTFIGAEEIGRLALSDLFPDLIVEVHGITQDDGSLAAAKVEVYGPDPTASMQLLGVVANLGDGQFDIGGIPLALSEKTFMLDGNNQRISQLALQNGHSVETAGFGGGGSVLQSRYVRIFDIIRDERSMIGRISAISGQTFTIREQVLRVTDETVLLDPLGDPMEFGDLALRMRVEVKAIANSSGELVARVVQARPRDRKVTGTVLQIEGDYMAIAGLQVAVNTNTVFLNSDGESIDQSDIVPGLTVTLTMTLGPGGQPIATEVVLLPRIEDEVVLNGTVEAVLEDLIVVMGRRFQVIPNTQILDADGNPAALVGFSVGDAVRIRALLLAGDNLVALRIRELSDEAADIRVEGPIVSVSASTLEVMGIFFFLNEETQFFDLERNEVEFSSLAEGQTVAVVAEGQANGTIAARRVQVQNVSLTSGETSGIVDNQFSMFGNSYRVDENTMVLGENNVQLMLDDVEEGQYLEVRGVADAEGGVAGKNGSSILVSKIKIVDAEGSGEYELEIDPAPVTVEEEELPETYELFQNYPNPFNPVTTIRFTLPIQASVSVRVFDVMGREVQILVTGTMNAGIHEVQWNGRNRAGLPVASGVYLYRLEAAGNVITRRMVLLK